MTYTCVYDPPLPPPCPPPECEPSQVFIENITKSPYCFNDSPFTAQYGFTVRLGDVEPCADGIYWVTVNINEKTIKTTMSPGDADSYSESLSHLLGGNVRISANAYLPIKRIQSSTTKIDKFPEACPQPECETGCTYPESSWFPQMDGDPCTCSYTQTNHGNGPDCCVEYRNSSGACQDCDNYFGICNEC